MISSSRALCCLPLVKEQTHDFALELLWPRFSKRVMVHNHSLKCVFLARSFSCKSKSCPYERLCTGTRLETEVESSEWKLGNDRQLTTPKWEPQVGRGLFGISLLILHFKFQFSKSIVSLIFHIFLNLTYSLRKKYFFPKMSNSHRKIYTWVRGISRDIGRKAVFSDVKTAFTCTPP